MLNLTIINVLVVNFIVFTTQTKALRINLKLSPESLLNDMNISPNCIKVLKPIQKLIDLNIASVRLMNKSIDMIFLNLEEIRNLMKSHDLNCDLQKVNTLNNYVKSSLGSVKGSNKDPELLKSFVDNVQDNFKSVFKQHNNNIEVVFDYIGSDANLIEKLNKKSRIMCTVKFCTSFPTESKELQYLELLVDKTKVFRDPSPACKPDSFFKNLLIFDSMKNGHKVLNYNIVKNIKDHDFDFIQEHSNVQECMIEIMGSKTALLSLRFTKGLIL